MWNEIFVWLVFNLTKNGWFYSFQLPKDSTYDLAVTKYGLQLDNPGIYYHFNKASKPTLETTIIIKLHHFENMIA